MAFMYASSLSRLARTSVYIPTEGDTLASQAAGSLLLWVVQPADLWETTKSQLAAWELSPRAWVDHFAQDQKAINQLFYAFQDDTPVRLNLESLLQFKAVRSDVLIESNQKVTVIVDDVQLVSLKSLTAQDLNAIQSIEVRINPANLVADIQKIQEMKDVLSGKLVLQSGDLSKIILKDTQYLQLSQYGHIDTKEKSFFQIEMNPSLPYTVEQIKQLSSNGAPPILKTNLKELLIKAEANHLADAMTASIALKFKQNMAGVHLSVMTDNTTETLTTRELNQYLFAHSFLEIKTTLGTPATLVLALNTVNELKNKINNLFEISKWHSAKIQTIKINTVGDQDAFSITSSIANFLSKNAIKIDATDFDFSIRVSSAQELDSILKNGIAEKIGANALTFTGNFSPKLSDLQKIDFHGLHLLNLQNQYVVKLDAVSSHAFEDHGVEWLYYLENAGVKDIIFNTPKQLVFDSSTSLKMLEDQISINQTSKTVFNIDLVNLSADYLSLFSQYVKKNDVDQVHFFTHSTPEQTTIVLDQDVSNHHPTFQALLDIVQSSETSFEHVSLVLPETYFNAPIHAQEINLLKTAGMAVLSEQNTIAASLLLN